MRAGAGTAKLWRVKLRFGLIPTGGLGNDGLANIENDMPPFRIEFYCPRQSPFWQPFTEGLFFKTIKTFRTLEESQAVCNTLVWAYHAARVIDAAGIQRYSV